MQLPGLCRFIYVYIIIHVERSMTFNISLWFYCRMATKLLRLVSDKKKTDQGQKGNIYF